MHAVLVWCSVRGYSSGHATGMQWEQRWVKRARCRDAATVSFMVVSCGLRLVLLGVVAVTEAIQMSPAPSS